MICKHALFCCMDLLNKIENAKQIYSKNKASLNKTIQMHFNLISFQRESTKLLKQWLKGEWRLHLFNGAFPRSPPLYASQSRTPLQHASRNWTSGEKHGSVLIGAWAHCSCTKCIAEPKPVQSKTFNSGAKL